MAKQTAGFVDQHIEKVVLGVCAALFLGTAVYYFGMSPYKIDDKDPKKLIAEARDVAELTQKAVREAKPYDPTKDASNTKISTAPLEELAKWFGESPLGLIKIAGIDPRSPRTQAFPTPLLPLEGVADEERVQLARLSAPSAPIVVSGHAYLDMPAQMDFETLYKTGGSGNKESRERSWVSVAAQVNLAEQFKTFLAARYPHGMYMSMPIIRLHLQRKVVGEAGADWEEVTPYAPYKRITPPDPEFLPSGALSATSSTEINKFRTMIRLGQDMIARATLPPKTQGTRGDEPFAPPLPYIDIAPGVIKTDPGAPGPKPGTDINAAAALQRARDWLTKGTKALNGQKPFTDPDPELALMLARAASVTKGISTAESDRAKKLITDAEAALKTAKRTMPGNTPDEPEHLMPILAHDLEVTPGRTYVYRIRYEIFNPLIGSDLVRDPADGRKITLVSDWSPPSREVEVKSDLFYFLTKVDVGKQTAEFTVFKKIAGGEFEKANFDVVPGDIVGSKKKAPKSSAADFSTHKLCVLIDTVGKETRVVLADAVDGSLSERILAKDSKDKRIDELSGSGKRRGR